MALAFALRLGWALSVPTEVSEHADPQWYYVAAKNLADGHGLTISVALDRPPRYVSGPGGDEAIRWPQGYPLTLGAFFAMVDSTSLTTAKIVNVIAGTITVGLTFLLAYRLFGLTVGTISATLMALYPAHIIWTSVLYSDLLFGAPFLAAIVLFLWYGRTSPQALTLLGMGALMGYSALVRPQAVVLVVAMALSWYFASRDLIGVARNVALTSAGVAVFLVPSVAWNTARMGEPTLLSENFGYNLRVGHAPYSTGRYITPMDLWQPGVTEIRPGAFPDDTVGMKRAVKYAFTHPVYELELSARKVYYLFSTDSDALYWASNFGKTPIRGSDTLTQRIGDAADLAWFAVLILAIASLPKTLTRRHGLGFLWSIMALWVLVHIIFFGEPRYRLPIMPILTTFAAVALVELREFMPRASKPEPTIEQEPVA